MTTSKTYLCECCKQPIPAHRIWVQPSMFKGRDGYLTGECENKACRLYLSGQTLDRVKATP